MTASEIIEKARSFIGVINNYQMGGDHRTKPGFSDCSAFIWLVFGKSKCQKRIWWNTDKIYRDAMGACTQFELLSEAEDGCLAVYDKKHNGGKTGHVAFVSDAEKKKIIDCSSSQDGVHEHDGKYWWSHKGAIFIRYKAD